MRGQKLAATKSPKVIKLAPDTGVRVKTQAVAYAEEAIPMFVEVDAVPGYHQPSYRAG
jgi:hypothetical protein